MKSYQQKDMAGSGDTVAFALGLLGMAAVLFGASGCSGMEVGGRLGVYRVDERQESQRTYRQAVPLKCYFTSCAPADEAQGS